MSKNIHLAYFRGFNLGDELNPFIVSRLLSSDRIISIKDIHLIQGSFFRRITRYIKRFIKRREPTTVALPWQHPLLCIGSILRYASADSIIWGSGFMNANETTLATDIRAVRGPLTANKLGLKGKIPYGDPALLLPLFFKKGKTHSNILGIIPHFTEYKYFKDKYGDKYKVINLINTNPLDVVSEILSCSYILSTSLHGLIISHAYGIPAIWIKRGDIGSDGFKFEDYLLSVGITPYEGIQNIDDIFCSENGVPYFFDSNNKIALPEEKVIKNIQLTLIKSFPFN